MDDEICVVVDKFLGKYGILVFRLEYVILVNYYFLMYLFKDKKKIVKIKVILKICFVFVYWVYVDFEFLGNYWYFLIENEIKIIYVCFL